MKRIKLKHILNELHHWITKAYHSIEAFILPILTTLSIFLTPIKPLILLMIGFILLDTIFAIYANVKTKGINSFVSHKLFNIVPKSFLYSSTIILAFIIDIYIMGGSLFGISNLLSKLMCSLWIYIEVKSIDETSVKKLGNKSIWVLFKEFLVKLKSLKKDLNEIIDGNDEKQTEETN